MNLQVGLVGGDALGAGYMGFERSSQWRISRAIAVQGPVVDTASANVSHPKP